MRLDGVDLAGFDVKGYRQRLRGDTLTVTREEPSSLKAAYVLPNGARATVMSVYLDAEPLLEVNDPSIVALATRLRGTDTDPRVVAQRINTWLYDSLAKRVTFAVPRGQLFGFLGPNGAGKTTTLRMIAGILKPTAGSISIAGVDLATDPIGAKMRLGFIPDRPFIYEKLTGAEFLRFVAGLYEQQGDEVEHRARELMALFDLEDWRDELVESYSHGMRQKLIISSAFVHRPEVIVVDEPMVGLDPEAGRILKGRVLE